LFLANFSKSRAKQILLNPYMQGESLLWINNNVIIDEQEANNFAPLPKGTIPNRFLLIWLITYNLNLSIVTTK
jgi:hypothetical protein